MDSYYPHGTQPDRKPLPAQDSQSDPNSPPLPGPRPVDGHIHTGHRQNLRTPPDWSRQKPQEELQATLSQPGPRRTTEVQAAAPLLPDIPLPPPTPRAAGGAVNSQGLASWREGKGLPRLSPDAGKGLGCSVVPPHWAPGSMRAQGTCHTPFF